MIVRSARPWLARLPARLRAAAAARADRLQGLDRRLTDWEQNGVQVDLLQERLRHLERALRPPSGPFSAEMTIEAALRRHPGARRVFEAQHLPRCGACAVRHDETLAEAAAAYGIPLGGWLAALNALLPASDDPPTPAPSPAPEPP